MRRIKPSDRETGLAITHKWLKLWRGTVERALGKGPDKDFYLSLIRCLLGIVTAYRKWSKESGMEESNYSKASSSAESHMMGQLGFLDSKRRGYDKEESKPDQARSRTSGASLLEHLQHKHLKEEQA